MGIIESLIYQHDGVSPFEFSFSDSISDVVQGVNKKLLEEIKIYKETISQLQSKNESQKSLIERQRKDISKEITDKMKNYDRKLNEEKKKSEQLAKELAVKQTALANSKKA